MVKVAFQEYNYRLCAGVCRNKVHDVKEVIGGRPPIVVSTNNGCECSKIEAA